MSLKDLRKASGMTQKEAAWHFGIKPRTYQNYENGTTYPDMDTAARFARYFGCTIGDLFDLTEGREEISLDERALIGLYSQMSKTGREALMAVAETFAEKFPRE